MIKKEYKFRLEDKVRDYECDLQGVVNNANYQHYMEHARHEFLESCGVSFAEMHAEGLDGFVSQIDIRFKSPLRSGDRYISALNLRREGPKIIFEQDIYRQSDEQLAVTATVTTVIVKDGRLTRGEFFDQLF